MANQDDVLMPAYRVSQQFMDAYRRATGEQHEDPGVLKTFKALEYCAWKKNWAEPGPSTMTSKKVLEFLEYRIKKGPSQNQLLRELDYIEKAAATSEGLDLFPIRMRLSSPDIDLRAPRALRGEDNKIRRPKISFRTHVTERIAEDNALEYQVTKQSYTAVVRFKNNQFTCLSCVAGECKHINAVLKDRQKRFGY